MERQAKLYICMAMAKSSRLLRNWKKDLNSSKVMPWSWKKRAKRHRGKRNLLIWDIQPNRQSCHKLTWHYIPFLWATWHHTKSTSTICISYPSESVLNRRMQWWTKRNQHFDICKRNQTLCHSCLFDDTCSALCALPHCSQWYMRRWKAWVVLQHNVINCQSV